MASELKIVICLIIKDENEYLEEWLSHHRNLGFNHFFIYDNQSVPSVAEYFLEKNLIHSDITRIYWEDNKHGSQLRAYEHCCKQFGNQWDYIAFIDTDEFICLKNHNSIQEYIQHYIENYGQFDGLGICWRMYGSNYSEGRIPIEDYIFYHENRHIKSIVNPKKVIKFNDPHFATLNSNKYFDENNRLLTSPLADFHTSNEIWIKHIWTRSYPEWRKKLERGSGDKVIRPYSDKDFDNYNNQCTLHE